MSSAMTEETTQVESKPKAAQPKSDIPKKSDGLRPKTNLTPPTGDGRGGKTPLKVTDFDPKDPNAQGRRVATPVVDPGPGSTTPRTPTEEAVDKVINLAHQHAVGIAAMEEAIGNLFPLELQDEYYAILYAPDLSYEDKYNPITQYLIDRDLEPIVMTIPHFEAETEALRLAELADIQREDGSLNSRSSFHSTSSISPLRNKTLDLKSKENSAKTMHDSTATSTDPPGQTNPIPSSQNPGDISISSMSPGGTSDSASPGGTDDSATQSQQATPIFDTDIADMLAKLNLADPSVRQQLEDNGINVSLYYDVNTNCHYQAPLTLRGQDYFTNLKIRTRNINNDAPRTSGHHSPSRIGNILAHVQRLAPETITEDRINSVKKVAGSLSNNITERVKRLQSNWCRRSWLLPLSYSS